MCGRCARGACMRAIRRFLHGDGRGCVDLDAHQRAHRGGHHALRHLASGRQAEDRNVRRRRARRQELAGCGGIEAGKRAVQQDHVRQKTRGFYDGFEGTVSHRHPQPRGGELLGARRERGGIRVRYEDVKGRCGGSPCRCDGSSGRRRRRNGTRESLHGVIEEQNFCRPETPSRNAVRDDWIIDATAREPQSETRVPGNSVRDLR